MSFAVLGTDTGVGKTVVCALIAARHGAARPVHYWKAVATGKSEGRDTEDVRHLAGPSVCVHEEGALFEAPLSPHLAARLEGQVIDPVALDHLLETHVKAANGRLIVEGAGGLLVPLRDEGPLLVDWIQRQGLAVLLVARSTLGTINHTLLSLEALNLRGVEVIGVVLVGPANPENRAAIQRHGRVSVIAEVPSLATVDPEAIAASVETFDVEGQLLRHLGPGSAPSSAWVQADRDHVWHPFTSVHTAPAPIPIARAEGVWLTTPGGRRILDGISSWWVNLHGHSHPRLVRALAEQAARLEQVIFAGFTHEPAARLAEALIKTAPKGLTRVFYSDDGSTSVEVAVKIAHQSWRNRGETQRNLVVAFEHGYHGDTFGAMALGAGTVFHTAFRDLLFEVRRAASPCCRAVSGCGNEGAPTLAEILEREGPRVSAVIVEPMLQGAGGMRMHAPEALAEIRALTTQHGIPLIADEVLTGFFRTGKMFAVEHAGISPDLMCLSKGLTGGMMPLGATLLSDELFQCFTGTDRTHTLFHGHSYTGNALACAVGLESLHLLEEGHAAERVARLEQIFRARLTRLTCHPRVASVRALGAVAAIDLLPTGGGGYLDPLGPKLLAAFLERGLLLRPLGDVIYVLPPYVIRDEEAEWIFDQIEAVLAEL